MHKAYRISKYSDNDTSLPCAAVFEDTNNDIWCIFNTKSNSINCATAKRGMNINVIGHEVFHITCIILNDAGIKLTEKTEETYAYLNGWLIENTSKVLSRLI